MKLNRSDLLRAGLSGWGIVPVEKVPFSQEFLDICRSNSCGSYNSCWACPPAMGTLEECKARIGQYKVGLVFNHISPLEDSFDFEGMQDAAENYRIAVDALHELVKAEGDNISLLANGGCSRCKTCTWPDAPCRFPDKLFPAIEGCGVYVSRLAALAGLKYINGQNTVTYFGMLLCKEDIEIVEDEL